MSLQQKSFEMTRRCIESFFSYSLIIIICSLHVMMDPAHTKAINATAVTIVLTAAMNIIAVSIDVEKLLSHPLLCILNVCDVKA